MKILVDSNVILDLFLMREPFISDSYRVMKLCSDKVIKGYAAAHTVTNLYYILRKSFEPVERRKIVLSIFKVLKIASVDGRKLRAALKNFDFKDFEDCLQDECAVAIGADYIITRDVKDFANSKVPALTPEEFMTKWNREIGQDIL